MIEDVTDSGRVKRSAQALHWGIQGRREATWQEDGPVPVHESVGSHSLSSPLRRRLSAPAALRRFVEGAYELVLGRPADPAGLEHHLRFLEQGGARQQVLQGLAASPEGEALRLRPRAVGRVRSLARSAGLEQGESRLEAHLVELYTTLLETAERHDRRSAALEALVAHAAQRPADMDGARSAAVEDRFRAVEQLLQQAAEERRQLVQEHRQLDRAVEEGQQRVAELQAQLARQPRPVVLAGAATTVVEVDGLLVGVPAAEWRLAAYLASRGNPEPGLTARFLQVVGPGAVVVDVGANIGLYTLHAARAVGLAGQVHAFEPTPAVHDLLAENVQVNGHRESGVVRLHRLALADEDGEANFAVYGDNNGHNSLYPKSGDDDLLRVPVRRLDDVLGDEVALDVVKVDVEGAELRVLAGMQRLAERSPQAVVFCEVAPEHLARAGTSARQFLDDVSELGWSVQLVEEPSGRVRPLVPDDLARPSCNVELRRLDA